MPIPIVLPVTDFTRRSIKGAKAVALTNAAGVPLAILRTPEVYELRVRELLVRTWGVIDDVVRLAATRPNCSMNTVSPGPAVVMAVELFFKAILIGCFGCQ